MSKTRIDCFTLRCIIGGNLPPIIINGVANTVALTTGSIENTRVIFALITRRSSVQIRPPQPSLRTLKFQRFQGFLLLFLPYFLPRKCQKQSKTINISVALTVALFVKLLCHIKHCAVVYVRINICSHLYISVPH